MSAVTGRSTASAIFLTMNNMSSRLITSPSGQPSDQAMPALDVAMTG
jgi:hypothetical protein